MSTNELTYTEYMQAHHEHEKLVRKAERHATNDTDDARIARESFRRILELRQQHPDYEERRYREHT